MIKLTLSAEERKPKTIPTKRRQIITINNLPTIDVVFETPSDQTEADPINTSEKSFEIKEI